MINHMHFINQMSKLFLKMCYLRISYSEVKYIKQQYKAKVVTVKKE